MSETKPQSPDATAADAILDQAVAQGGAYEVLSKRLGEQGARLRAIADTLNTQRLAEFGSSRMDVAGRLRIRTAPGRGVAIRAIL